MGRPKKPRSLMDRWFSAERRRFLKTLSQAAATATPFVIFANSIRDLILPPNRTPAPPPATPKRHVIELHDTLKVGEQSSVTLHTATPSATNYAGPSTTNTISGTIRLTPKP